MYNWHHNYYCYKALAHHGIKARSGVLRTARHIRLIEKIKTRLKKRRNQV